MSAARETASAGGWPSGAEHRAEHRPERCCPWNRNRTECRAEPSRAGTPPARRGGVCSSQRRSGNSPPGPGPHSWKFPLLLRTRRASAKVVPHPDFFRRPPLQATVGASLLLLPGLLPLHFPQDPPSRCGALGAGPLSEPECHACHEASVQSHGGPQASSGGIWPSRMPTRNFFEQKSVTYFPSSRSPFFGGLRGASQHTADKQV